MTCARPMVRLAAAVAVGLTALGVLLPATRAAAVWTVSWAASGGGTATVMPTGNAPTGRAASGSVTLVWAAADMTDGTAVAGYVVNRFDAATGASATVNAGCAGVVAAVTCTEDAVPAGTWDYTVTPVQLSWTGGQSPASAPVTVP